MQQVMLSQPMPLFSRGSLAKHASKISLQISWHDLPSSSPLETKSITC